VALITHRDWPARKSVRPKRRRQDAVLEVLADRIGVGLFGSASGVIAYDIYLAAQLRRLLGRKAQEGGSEAGEKAPRPLAPVRWKLAQRLAVLAVAPLPLGPSNVRVRRAAARAHAN